ncbi:RWP-RK domain-containing protein [Klebsormidium nitens]|uniref:RWP-RK domain-containing protein n=1 Tax=Klebsormidium nitens TaxID=105231 RepID=A0A1Y1ITG0_KLENI|nr:RWP-RK domain-containing protein [Klebsormidium nitens]|eukprot:GAQ91468.1 RWP-RK domain-containing protein [Klebsormidium nitens]
MKKKAEGAASSSGTQESQSAAESQPSLEVLAAFQHQSDPDSIRSLHVYAQGASLFAIQQDLMLSSPSYRVLNQPLRMMLPSWSAMAGFVDSQKKGHAAGGWICILDFAVYDPLPTSMCPLLAPSRNPLLGSLPSVYSDLVLVEAVIKKGAEGGRAEPTLRPTQCIPSPPTACVSQESDARNSVPFIGSRVHRSLSLPSPRQGSMVESNSPNGSLWNDVDSFTDLLSCAQSPGIPSCPLVSLHPNFPSPTKSPGPSNPTTQRLDKGPHPMLTSPNTRAAGQLYPPPGGFGGRPGSEPRADPENFPSPNFVPFIPGFISDRAWGPWAHVTGYSDFHQQLAFLAEYPAFIPPDVTPGSLYDDLRQQQEERGDPSDQETEGLLYRPPPRLEIPGSPGLPEVFADDTSSVVPERNRSLLPRSRSTIPSERPAKDAAPFQRASSAPASGPPSTSLPSLGDSPLVDPALLSPIAGGLATRENDPPASLWVCINAEASEGVRPGVSFLPPGGSISRVRITPLPVDGDQMNQMAPEFEPRFLPTPNAVHLGDPPVPNISPRRSEPDDDFMTEASILTDSSVCRDSPRSPLSEQGAGTEFLDPRDTPGDQSPVSLTQASVRTVFMSRDPKRATARMERITLEEMQTYFDVPIVGAARLLGVGLTVLKKRCRDFGIPRWPHRKIKSIKVLIDNIKELADPKDSSSVPAASFGDAVQRLEMERAQIAGRPAIRMAEETLKLRQACFKANFRIRAQASGRNTGRKAAPSAGGGRGSGRSPSASSRVACGIGPRSRC